MLRVPPGPSEIPGPRVPEIPVQPELPTTRPDPAPLPHPVEVPERPPEIDPSRELRGEREPGYSGLPPATGRVIISTVRSCETVSLTRLHHAKTSRTP